MIEIKQYNLDDAAKWNEFVTISKQGTFLFNRNYMDYHSDRFTDSSFLIMEKGRISAALPANRKGDTLYSHQGLTYGGLLTTEILEYPQQQFNCQIRCFSCTFFSRIAAFNGSFRERNKTLYGYNNQRRTAWRYAHLRDTERCSYTIHLGIARRKGNGSIRPAVRLYNK